MGGGGIFLMMINNVNFGIQLKHIWLFHYRKVFNDYDFYEITDRIICTIIATDDICIDLTFELNIRDTKTDISDNPWNYTITDRVYSFNVIANSDTFDNIFIPKVNDNLKLIKQIYYSYENLDKVIKVLPGNETDLFTLPFNELEYFTDKYSGNKLFNFVGGTGLEV
jgi:hypothetical protein